MHSSPFYLVVAVALTTLSAHGEHMEELVVTAIHDTRTVDVTSELVISPDVAQLLKKKMTLLLKRVSALRL